MPGNNFPPFQSQSLWQELSKEILIPSQFLKMAIRHYFTDPLSKERTTSAGTPGEVITGCIRCLTVSTVAMVDDRCSLMCWMCIVYSYVRVCDVKADQSVRTYCTATAIIPTSLRYLYRLYCAFHVRLSGGKYTDYDNNVIIF